MDRPQGEAFDGLMKDVSGQPGMAWMKDFENNPKVDWNQVAGCVAYTVWVTGQHVSYFGRNGETHIERFPD